MTQIQGSFVLTRDIEDTESAPVSDVRVRALASTDPTRSEVTAFFKSVQKSVVDGVHVPTPLSSDDEDDNGLLRPQTTTRTVLPNDLYDSDPDSEDDNGLLRPQTTTRTVLPNDLYDTDLDSEDENERPSNHTAKSLYLSNCKKYGVLPSSMFINIINTSSPCADLRYSAVKPLSVKVMLLSLKMTTTVTKLDLSGNGFGSLGAIYVAEFIKYSDYIVDLDLSNNDIGLTGCEALCGALRSVRTIRSLILDGNRLDDKCAMHLAKLLASHEYLLHVSLSKNLFESISTARTFSTALSDNQSIEHLDISFNHFQQKITGVFIRFLSTNSRLRSLNLSHSSFGLDASKAFSLAMKTKTTQLEELDLSSNLIDDECAKYLASVLSINESLKRMNLMQNPLSVNGCFTLLKPLKTMPTSQLERIDIRDIYIKSEAFISLANDLEERFPKLVIRRGEKINYPE